MCGGTLTPGAQRAVAGGEQVRVEGCVLSVPPAMPAGLSGVCRAPRTHRGGAEGEVGSQGVCPGTPLHDVLTQRPRTAPALLGSCARVPGPHTSSHGSESPADLPCVPVALLGFSASPLPPTTQLSSGLPVSAMPWPHAPATRPL